MPKNPEINKVLLIGSGPIVISQGCEFDYSGTQACKALKEEGCYVILINPNPATIMTDPEIADVTYVEPIVSSILEEIIDKERPDAILPTMGGQTALNATLKLDELGILEKYGIRVIGVNLETIKKAEDRQTFRNVLEKAKLDFPNSLSIQNLEELKHINFPFGYPKIVRTSYTLGGSGSGIANNADELMSICKEGFRNNPNTSILIEESLIGWKEFELEVMADSKDNFIVVCPIENFDPMGVHTGDSITVAPTQTLTDKEYQRMRNAAKLLMKEIGMTSGGCNVQFAVNPSNGRIVVIEINPRVSRSSALASKATGFPIAKIAAKISLGYSLNELKNEITEGMVPASFEPSIDYVVVKIPRFTFDKFPEADSNLSTQMKSIGEVIGIGRVFQDALQKAIRSLEIDASGLLSISKLKNQNFFKDSFVCQKLEVPNEERIFYIMEAFCRGWQIEDVYRLTGIDTWFLNQIKEIATLENALSLTKEKDLSKEELLFLKKKGFSDKQLAQILKISERDIYSQRKVFGISPVYKRIDTCSAEFPSNTSYLYSCYEQFCETAPTNNKKIVIIGSGPNRIGQGIEFDYCCVHASLTLRELGYEAIMINSNPETVSTDYDSSDRLYFEPLTLEDIREILNLEKPNGIFTQFGGQTSLLLAKHLSEEDFTILGTQPEDIDKAEDRIEFKKIIDKLELNQPPSITIETLEEALSFGDQEGYPVILRTSFVIGGRGFAKIHTQEELSEYFKKNHLYGRRVLLEKFIEDALEIDLDAIMDGEDLAVCGIMEHYQSAGVHSGDSISIFPSQNLNNNIISKLIDYSTLIAFELKIKGFLNLQFLIKGNDIFVLEVNPRASRTIPFISKATGVPFVKIATKVLLGQSLKEQKIPFINKSSLVAIKTPIFSFDKLSGANKNLGIEMKSTGEVMTLGASLEEALIKKNFFSSSSNEINDVIKNVYSLQRI